VQPALTRPDKRHITRPDTIRLLDIELLLQEIRRGVWHLVMLNCRALPYWSTKGAPRVGVDFFSIESLFSFMRAPRKTIRL